MSILTAYNVSPFLPSVVIDLTSLDDRDEERKDRPAKKARLFSWLGPPRTRRGISRDCLVKAVVITGPKGVPRGWGFGFALEDDSYPQTVLAQTCFNTDYWREALWVRPFLIEYPTTLALKGVPQYDTTGMAEKFFFAYTDKGVRVTKEKVRGWAQLICDNLNHAHSKKLHFRTDVRNDDFWILPDAKAGDHTVWSDVMTEGFARRELLRQLQMANAKKRPGLYEKNTDLIHSFWRSGDIPSAIAKELYVPNSQIRTEVKIECSSCSNS